MLYSNDLAIWHNFPDITHITVNNGRKWAIFNFIVLKFYRAYPSPLMTDVSHTFFHRNGLAIGHSFPYIMHIKKIITAIFEHIQAIGEIGKKIWSDTYKIVE